MGKEMKMSEFEVNGGDEEEANATATTVVVDDEDDVDQRVHEWEVGLPSCDDLTQLSQSLIPPELAFAFSISPEPRRTALDVNSASCDTLSSLRSSGALFYTTNNNKNKNDSNKNLRSFNDPMVVEPEGDGSGSCSVSEPKKMRKTDTGIAEEADSAVRATENSEDPSAMALKRQRLVWTPQLHKRFVDVVTHLGIKNAVPKTIMQLMNVEGLTRENVASHLQKYRLYLKRMQGLSNEGPLASDQLFASTTVPLSLHESGRSGGSGVGGGSANGHGHVRMPIPMPYGAPLVPVAMPMYGHVGMHQGGYHHRQNGYEANSYGMQPRDWSGGNK